MLSRWVRPVARFGRALASKGPTKAPQFSQTESDAYVRFFQEHAQEGGPWLAIVRAVQAHAPGGDRPRILDLAAGPGEPACTLARAIPGAHVIASDVSEAMIEKAKAYCRDVSNVHVVTLDAHDLSAVAPASQDAVVCCYGVMFFDDPDRAFAEVARVLKPGGVFVATHWKEMPIIQVAAGPARHLAWSAS